MQKGIMRVLGKAFESSDLDCREYAAFCIANICSNPDFVTMVGHSGGIAMMMMLSKSENINTLCLGLAALRRLANSEENWAKLIQAGGWVAW